MGTDKGLSATLRVALCAFAVLVLGACGQGSSDPAPPASTGPAPEPATAVSASRFLAQASFGANMSSVEDVSANGAAVWLDRQFAMSAGSPHQNYLVSVMASLPADQSPQDAHVMNTFWRQAATAPDQLRHRAAFALSQIFVVSLTNDAVAEYRRGVASYLDMLGREAFGNYRDLLEAVTLHPMMGLFLSHLRNQKESGNRIPDQNYAREVMQLFSIGLYQLNADGTLLLANGQPVETYGQEDIVGLSRVFTGFSWAGPDTQNGRFFGSSTPTPDPNRDVLPMQAYPQYHSTSVKSFLGITIPAQSAADPRGDLRIALDTIFNHPNVAPFCGRQLIQRLVTSNPTPAYVGRVSQAFNAGRFTRKDWSVGTGRRGDLRAAIAAVLLDEEARDMAKTADPTFGKVREPVLRLGAWMRAFNARSASGNFLLGGAVQGGTIYGTFPQVTFNTGEDVGQGSLLPTTSVDQYAATLGRWLGIADERMPDVLPNIGNFGAARYLGFLA